MTPLTLTAAIVLGIPAYAVIATLVYLLLRKHWPSLDYLCSAWPVLVALSVPWAIGYVLAYWPIRLTLRLPGWLARRRERGSGGDELPRARTVQR